MPIALFDVLLQFYLLEAYLLADGQAGKLAHWLRRCSIIEELRMRIVMPPAPGIAKLDEILLPTLDQRQLRAILSDGLCCRSDMKEAKPPLNRRFPIINVRD